MQFSSIFKKALKTTVTLISSVHRSVALIGVHIMCYWLTTLRMRDGHAALSSQCCSAPSLCLWLLLWSQPISYLDFLLSCCLLFVQYYCLSLTILPSHNMPEVLLPLTKALINVWCLNEWTCPSSTMPCLLRALPTYLVSSYTSFLLLSALRCTGLSLDPLQC